jgi:hypothetical protein
MLTLVEGGSAKVTGDPVPPIPSRIDLVASGSVAVTPTAPAQPIQFGSLDVQHTGEIDFGAMALEHGGEVDFGSIDVNHGGGGGPVAYQPNGKPAGAFFFDTCSLRPISKSELEKRLEQPLHMSNLPSGDEDIADSNENCIKRFSKELADYHFNCSNPDISPNDCIGADDWLETSADDIKNFIAPLDINSLGRLKEGLVGDNRIEVFGYADQETPDTGKPLNENLSILRARAIAAALTAMGIEPTRIRTFGYGDRMPLVPATEKNGRYLINRRADVFLLNLDSIP